MLWLILAALSTLCRAQDDKDFFHFVTRPDIGALTWDIQIYDREALQPGYYWFIAPYLMLVQSSRPIWQGPYIYDDKGQLIWSGAPFVKHSNTFDFRMSMVDGQQMLSFIGPPLGNRGSGIILDNTYRVHEVVDMVGKNHTMTNMHEFNLIDDGKRALMAIKQEYRHPTRINVTDYEGTCRIGWQGFKEVDVKTNEVLFEWTTRGHIDIEETNFVSKHIKHYDWEHKCSHEWGGSASVLFNDVKPDHAADITHINAVDKFDDGDYLISARHTDTIYKISHKDHSIVWRLGGSRSDFVMKDPRAKFSRQHHARFLGQNETHTLISLFDNAIGSGSVEVASDHESYGLHLALRTDVRPMEVDVITRFEKPLGRTMLDGNHDYTASRGSVTFLPNGNAFIDWVHGSHIAEYSSNGTLLMSAMLSKGFAASYRSYKMPWVGRPAHPPDVVARALQAANEELRTFVYVSWNGDTEVASWTVLHTNPQGNVSQLVAAAPRGGFETRISVDGFARHIVAVGLDSKGEELRRSKVVTVTLPPDLRNMTLSQEEHEWLESHEASWWEAPAVKQAANLVSETKLVIMGSVIGIILFFAGLGLWLRRNRNQQSFCWWRSRDSSYKPVVTEEDEIDRLNLMLDEKAEYEIYEDEIDTPRSKG